ncbi:MAG: DNA (cytosine-5-)-methyltransferase [Spirochaetales bacterium]|nr:DNA (cytosine-5-)-methyltransferase [Spirochaetales bacterium]
MSKQIHCTFDDSLFEELSDLACVQGLSTQKVITDALISYINRAHNGISNNNYSYDFIDLFAGIGGMRIAFQNAGCRCVFSSEWDKNCQKTYYANFGEIPYGDITKINAKDIPNHDILVAGFPCQPFSIAGVSKKNSMGRATGFADKTQGTLFFDVCRIIAEKRPKAFMLENVKNLKSHDKGNTWKVIKSSLEELNYSVYSGVFDGQDFVPQHRERVLIVGFDKERYGEVPFEFDYNTPDKKPVLKDILFDEYDTKYILTPHLWKYLQNYAAKHKAAGNGFGYGMPDLNGISRTLSARYYKDGSEILINRGEGEIPRRLTPRECARLQGYPDYFKIVVSDTQAYKQFGNSVVVPLMSSVASLIVEKLNSLKETDFRKNSYLYINEQNSSI